MLGCVGPDRRDWRMPGATARLVYQGRYTSQTAKPQCPQLVQKAHPVGTAS